MLMYEIVDNNQYDTEICKYEIHIKDYNVRRRKKLTTKGWDFLMIGRMECSHVYH